MGATYLHKLAERVKAAHDRALSIVDGKTVTLLSGPYKGRKAMVNQVRLMDDGDVWLFVAIPKADGDGCLHEPTRKDRRRGYQLTEVKFGWERG